METQQKQRVAGLRFVLYSRPVHPELFDIHHDHRICKGGYEARIWVTGLSHVIGVYAGEAMLTELIAPASAELPLRGKLASLPVRGEKDKEISGIPGLRYMVSIQLEKMGQRLYKRMHNELATAGGEGGIFVSFPQWASNGLTPFTYIAYTARARLLHVFAFHAFPDELSIIKTQSLFELAKGGGRNRKA